MVANPYNAQSIVGYNASPPADDGSEVASNQVEWQKHLDKIGDPIRILAQAIDTELQSAFQLTINTATDQDNHIDGSLAFTPSTGTIATGALANPTRSNFSLRTQGATKYDDLVQITVTTTATVGGGEIRDGGILILGIGATTENVRVRSGAGSAGSIFLSRGRDAWLTQARDRLLLLRNGNNFQELSRRPDEFGGDRGYIDGFRVRNNLLSNGPNLQFFGGQALLNGATGYDDRLFDRSDSLVKDLTAGWDEGASGGMAVGVTATASQDMHCFVIGRYDGQVDYGFDISTSATALLETATDYFWQRRVASLRLSSTGGVQNVRTDGDGWIYLPRPLIEIDRETLVTGTDRFATLGRMPFNMGFRGKFIAMLENEGATSTDNYNVKFGNPDDQASVEIVDDNDFTLRLLGTTATTDRHVSTVHFEQWTSASASATDGHLVYVSDVSATNVFLSLWTVAYQDHRGRDTT